MFILQADQVFKEKMSRVKTLQDAEREFKVPGL